MSTSEQIQADFWAWPDSAWPGQAELLDVWYTEDLPLVPHVNVSWPPEMHVPSWPDEYRGERKDSKRHEPFRHNDELCNIYFPAVLDMEIVYHRLRRIILEGGDGKGTVEAHVLNRCEHFMRGGETGRAERMLSRYFET